MTKKCNFKYTGAMVLGMHDALVEISGIIAGLTFAIASQRVIIMTGAIAAVAASLSMSAANYMAQRADGNPNAAVCAAYTGMMYIATSMALLAPFCVIRNRFWAVGVMCAVVVGVVLIFNWYIGKKNRRPWHRAFWQMLGVCLGVSGASFLIGQAAKYFLGVTI
ncbi:MAG: VIT1/CCC1 transporter family protein [Alphaproteobacteria bacterium]|nr:VIT1/CCC1 transporter family protein [Alphaproteobacteria bacterium]MDE6571579.1 VIT1/CCC1 transporter family protein [Alphaproteobacteria bacterium]